MPSPARTTLLCTAIALISTAPAHAETLREALAAAYENNPTLTAARAGQRATDENVPIVRSSGLPRAGATGDYTEVVDGSSSSALSPDRSIGVQAQIAIPVYSGGTVRNGVRAAESRVEAGQADLRAVEAAVFADVVAAYMDVLRDEAVVTLNSNNVEVLGVNLQATQDRFDIGDLTRTDVAQSQARLALAQGQLRAAEARLIGSRETYIRLVGHAPDKLETPPALPGMPSTTDGAVEVALAENADLESAQINSRAVGYDVRAARGARLPQVSIVGGGGYSNYLGSLGTSGTSQSQTNATAGLSLTLPLYQGGAPAARVRQAQARQSQAMEAVIGTERAVIAQTRAAYASWRAANSVIDTAQVAVDANRLSLEGVRAENSVGTRSILDILNAEQELLNAQVQLVTARRDAYVAGFTLLAAMGRAEAEDLQLVVPGQMYDPDVNYQRVRRSWSDWNDDPAPQPVASRTVTAPAQTAAVTNSAMQPAAVPVRSQ